MFYFILLVVHSMLFGWVFFFLIVHMDRKFGRKGSWLYLLIRFIPILVFSVSNGHLIRNWPPYNEIALLCVQFVPGVVLFALLLTRNKGIEMIKRK